VNFLPAFPGLIDCYLEGNQFSFAATSTSKVSLSPV